jgi:choline dehydrogenase-like flavoprotein
MDHPHSRFLTVTLNDPALARRFGRVAVDSNWPSAASALRLSDATQRAHRLLNLALTQPELLVPPAGGDATAVGEAAARVDGGQPSYLLLEARGEQAPNPESRVTLTGERDALGARRVRLDWRLQAQDAGSLRAAARLLGRELGAQGLGRVHCGIGAPAVEALAAGEAARRLRGGPHHMGTTRMHRDPRHGVVDADCRVHGVDNLFVAGASVFPTCGCSNPTLTLLALALRLAAHLRRELRR